MKKLSDWDWLQEKIPCWIKGEMMILVGKSLRGIIRTETSICLYHLLRLLRKLLIPSPLSLVKMVWLGEGSYRIDFICEYDEKELRRRVSNAWCDTILERMNSLGTNLFLSLLQVLNTLQRALIPQAWKKYIICSRMSHILMYELTTPSLYPINNYLSIIKERTRRGDSRWRISVFEFPCMYDQGWFDFFYKGTRRSSEEKDKKWTCWRVGDDHPFHHSWW